MNIQFPSPQSLPPDPRWMRRAIALATENAASGRGGPFGALVVRGSQLLAEAANSVTRTLDPTAHAEVNAIRAACRATGSFSLAGAVLYASCEPCPMCLAAALWARVDAVYFGASSADAARAGFDDEAFYRKLQGEPGQPPSHGEQLLRDEALSSFEAWIRASTKTPY